MRDHIKPYYSGIEKKIIEEIVLAKKSIYIAMAWFTSDAIKDALLKTISDKQIELKILLDNNSTNEKYFFNNENKYASLYLKTKMYNEKFLHQKKVLIDSKIVIVGSYNLTNRAKSNLESIVVINSSKLCRNEERVFSSLYEENYIDKNIKLLFKYPEFTRILLSTYYNFNKNQYKKYESKIELGQCFSFDNGFNDQVVYVPGLIFNKSIRHKKVNTTNIFDKNYISTEIENLPINKTSIKEWVMSNRVVNVINSFQGHEHLYHMINDEIDNAQNSVESYFRRKIESCYSYAKLESLIKGNIDIIAEDELWKTNFEPFLNSEIVDSLFQKIELKQQYF